jgi:hypothetical protein
MARRRRSIPGAHEAVPLPLFAPAERHLTGSYPEGTYPPYEESADAVLDMLHGPHPILGLDFEFSDRAEITVVGVATPDACAAYSATDPGGHAALEETLEAIQEYVRRGGVLSAYAGITADRDVLRRGYGITIPLEAISDGMIRHWLCSAHLCKAPGARSGGDDDDPEEQGSYGFLGLWSAASFYTHLPAWKTCRGLACDGPCPRHDIVHYCAVDAWAGLQVDLRARERMAELGIPAYHYDMAARIADLMHGLHVRGIQVDPERLATLSAELEARRAALAAALPYNPNSPKQVVEHYRGTGVVLPSASIADVRDALARLEVPTDLAQEWESVDDFARLEEPARSLLLLYAYKRAGKGVKPWFARLDSKHRVYPRFSVTGTSTGRLSCTAPNLQNVASRGWGARVKGVIVPSTPGGYILEFDYSQLELRMMLYLAGVDVAAIGADAFAWLVEQCPGPFQEAGARLGMKPRDIAKITSHAADYLEGITLVSPARARRGERGLRVYCDWYIGHQIVAFTGANLAQRLYGKITPETREQALGVQEDIYFRTFPQIRTLQRQILDDALPSRLVRIRTGRVLSLPPDPLKAAKIAAAMHGQGTSADFVKESMLRLVDRLPWIYDHMMPQVHDSIVIDLPAERRSEVRSIYEILTAGSTILPGFLCPGKIKIGPTYGDLEDITDEVRS